MSFVQLIGDQQIYALIKEVKHKNPVLFQKTLPRFDITCTFQVTIYAKFKGLRLEANPANSSVTPNLKDLEDNSSNSTSFQEKFNNIFNNNDVHQYIQSSFESIRNMDSPKAKLLVMLYGNTRHSVLSLPINAHPELEIVSNFLANDVITDISIQ